MELTLRPLRRCAYLARAVVSVVGTRVVCSFK